MTILQAPAAILQVRGVERRFASAGGSTLALQATDLQVAENDFVTILGPSGCGKSTLLRILCGIYPADQGRVTVNGTLTPVLELGVGWNPELDAIDNIELIGAVLGLPLDDIRRQTHEILAFAELERFANLKLMHYSSGMSARLSYAIAFRAVRDVLILDEVFAVGDAGFRARCEARYKALRAEGHTTVIVSHDPRVIATFCDRALLLDQGRISFEGAPAEVADRYLELLGRPA